MQQHDLEELRAVLRADADPVTHRQCGERLDQLVNALILVNAFESAARRALPMDDSRYRALENDLVAEMQRVCARMRELRP